ncbi:DNA translocase ftsK domain protein [Escherichia coli]|nr:DNA translocase ftsK domain protein [Escherichia coli]
MPGAWLADTLFFIFGVMAYTIPVIMSAVVGLPGVISPATNTLIILPFRYASLAFWRSSLPPVVWRQSTLTISVFCLRWRHWQLTKHYATTTATQ